MLNKHAWNYIGQAGKVTLIALQHDTKTGDLLVFYGNELLWAERGVRRAEVISFFAEDELCRIHIVPKGNSLHYEFEIDRSENTPLNQIRKAEQRKNLMQGLLFVGGIVAFLGLFSLSGYLFNAYSDDKALRESGVETVAIFQMAHGFGRNNPEIACRISVRNMYIDSWIAFRTVGDSAVLPCGLPIYKNDAFAARIDPAELTNNRIDFDAPTEETLRELIFRTRNYHYSKHPSLRLEDIDCMVRRVYKVAGLRGMADFFYQDEPPIRNLLHNFVTYRLLIAQPRVKEEVFSCF